MLCTVLSLLYFYIFDHIQERLPLMLCTVLSLFVYTYLIISRKDSPLCPVQYYHSLFIHTWSSLGKTPPYALYSIISLCLYILDHLQEGLLLMLCTVLSVSVYKYLIISRKYSRLCSVQYYQSLFIHTWSSPGRPPAYALYSFITLYLCSVQYYHSILMLCTVLSLSRVYILDHL